MLFCVCRGGGGGCNQKGCDGCKEEAKEGEAERSQQYEEEASRSWKRPENKIIPQSLQSKRSPADTLIFGQQDPFWIPELQNCKWLSCVVLNH